MFRMLLGLAVVWILIPHEPDVGMGRPGLSRERIEADVARAFQNVLAVVDRSRTCTEASKEPDGPWFAGQPPGPVRSSPSKRT